MLLELTIPDLHPAQWKIRNEFKRFNTINCGRRFGKTTLGSDLVTDTILDCKPVGWFAPNDKLLDGAWDELKLLFEPITTYKNEVKKRLKFIGGGKIEMWSMEARLVARSRKYQRVIIDEAAMIDKLKERWQKEIRPTLADYGGDAWFFTTPNGHDDFKELYDLDGIEPDWKAWKMPSWENPFLPPDETATMQRLCAMGDRVALQEYGADFVASEDVFVNPAWLDACSIYGGMPPMRTNQPIIVGLDAASVSDTFAIVGIYRDWSNGGRYSTAFVRVFEPSELREGHIISFSKPRAFVAALKQSYHVVAYVYDPFQMVDFAGQGMLDGLGFFHQMNQGQDRLFADRHFYEIIRDRRFAFDGQAHQVLGQHIKNANSKLTDDKLRMIKRKDELKIDAGVAASMACYAAAEWYNI